MGLGDGVAVIADRGLQELRKVRKAGRLGAKINRGRPLGPPDAVIVISLGPAPLSGRERRSPS
jgi:hypothetical protein